MAKKVLIAVVAVAAIVSLAIYGAGQPDAGYEGLDMTRTHGTVMTATGSPILGDPDATITIIEFGDYQCHQCYNWFHNTKPAISEAYIETGVANLVFVDMAFLGRDSPVAAQASYCAGDQDAYWEYHDILYESQEPQIDNGWAGGQRLKALAFSLGLDAELFNECLDSKKYQKRVQNNLSEGRSKGVSGTPTFFIVSSDGAEQRLVGAQPYSVFKSVIDSMI